MLSIKIFFFVLLFIIFYYFCMSLENPDRIIVDVDVGLDDAAALFLLLHADTSGKIKIEAITCVNGNTNLDNVITNVLRLLELANRTDIPVYKGANSSLILPEKHVVSHFGTDGFGNLTYNTTPNFDLVRKETAVLAIGNIIVNNPGKISLICLGPLTNIALALKVFPRLMEDVKDVFIMGGNHKGIGNISPWAEFNFFTDPEAAYIILENLKKPATVFTWETTLDTTITMDWRYDTLGTIENPLLDLITRAERKGRYPNSTIWKAPDAFLAGCYLYPNEMILKKSMKYATVELQSWKSKGEMLIDHMNKTGKPPNIILIEEFNNEFLKNLFLKAARGS